MSEKGNLSPLPASAAEYIRERMYHLTAPDYTTHKLAHLFLFSPRDSNIISNTNCNNHHKARMSKGIMSKDTQDMPNPEVRSLKTAGGSGLRQRGESAVLQDEDLTRS